MRYTLTILSVILSGRPDQPSGAAMDVYGDILVSNSLSSDVNTIYPDGSTWQLNSGASLAGDVALDQFGNAYVADTFNNSVEEISGSTKTTIGTGSNAPEGIAVDSPGNVYVADTNNNAIKEICTNGSTISLGGGFDHPAGVTVDLIGDVFVTDTGHGLVKEIFRNGTIVTLNNVFSDPWGIEIDNAGILYVTDPGMNVVELIYPDGSNTQITTNVLNAKGIAVGPSGDMCLATSNMATKFIASGYINSSTNVTKDWYGPDTWTDLAGTQDTGGNYLDCVNVNITAQDIGSGVNVTYYNLDNGTEGPWNVYDGNPVNVTAIGDHYFYFYATDMGGNDGNINDIAFTVVSSSFTPMLANFTADATNGPSPLTVQFNDTSSGSNLPDTWDWEVNDSFGTPVYSDTDQNFTYTFLIPGTYSVTLSASNSSTGESSMSDPQTIVVSSNFVASFVVDQTVGPMPLTVQFNDTSSGNNAPDTWDREIYNSNDMLIYTNASQNFTYTFLTSDIYNVNFHVSNSTTTESATAASQSINVTSNIVASFSTDQSSGIVPLSVVFNDTSSGSPTSWDWSIDNSSGPVYSINSQNFSYQFLYPDTYTVTLTVQDAYLHSSTASHTVDVLPSMLADFTSNVTGGTAPLDVQFNDSSIGYPDSWLWTIYDQGNLVYSDTHQNVTYHFADPGDYTVMLQVANGTRNDSLSKLFTVDAPATLTAGFIADQAAGTAPLTVQFNDTSAGYPDTWDWSITNSTGPVYSTTARNFTYMFQYPDTYTVTLQVFNGTMSDTASSQVIVTSQTQLFADFTAIPDSGAAPLMVQFNDTSTGGLHSSEWNFGDSPVNSSSPSVSHIYNDPGTYTAILTVINGTISSTASHQIIVSSPVVPVAGFNANLTKGVEPLTVQFTDASTGAPTNWSWDFGDGNTSYARDPAHVYGSHGLYTVTLNASNLNGSNVMTRANYINVTVSLLHGGVYTAPLDAGWNMVSFPLDNDPMNASDLNGTGVSDVAVFNTTTGRYDIYMEGISTPDEDIPIMPGVGYFIYCDNPTDLDIKGTQPTLNSVSLHIGWNLIGWNSQTPSNAKAICAELAGNQEIVKYNTRTGYFQGYVEDASPDSYNFAIQPGEAYFVYTDTAQSLNIGGQ